MFKPAIKQESVTVERKTITLESRLASIIVVGAFVGGFALSMWSDGVAANAATKAPTSATSTTVLTASK